MTPQQRHRFLATHELRPFTTRTRTDVEELEAELGAVRAQAPVSEHGEFRDGVSCTAALVARRTALDPAWAVVVAVADEEVSERTRHRGDAGRQRPGRQPHLGQSSTPDDRGPFRSDGGALGRAGDGERQVEGRVQSDLDPVAVDADRVGEARVAGVGPGIAR